MARRTGGINEFKREMLPFGTSLARQIAKQNLSNLNNVYWVGERSNKLIRNSFSAIVMPTPGPGVHGYFGQNAAWQEGVDEFCVWRRQHVLISVASLLEVYVKSAAVAAFSAHPELIDKSLQSVDAFTFLKFPDRSPKRLSDLILERSDSFTVGVWSERFYRIQLIFGVLPESLLELEISLQSIQTIRNRIAHSYGTNGDLRRTPWEPMRKIEVSPKQIELATKTASEAIRILDNSVFGPIIGGFEMVHEFAIWAKKYKRSRTKRDPQNLESDFRDHIGGVYGRTPGREYNEAMISYYNSMK